MQTQGAGECRVLGRESGMSWMHTQGVGEQAVGCVLDGLLVRDLQVAPTSRHAHFLQPLPAKCAQLTAYSTRFRRRLLRLGDIPRGQKRCASAGALPSLAPGLLDVRGSSAQEVQLHLGRDASQGAQNMQAQQPGACASPGCCARGAHATFAAQADARAAVRRWIKAVRTIVAQRRVAGSRQEHIKLRMSSVEELARPFSSIFGSAVSVPQMAVRFHSPAPAKPRGHPQYRPPAPAHVDALVCLRPAVGLHGVLPRCYLPLAPADPARGGAASPPG